EAGSPDHAPWAVGRPAGALRRVLRGACVGGLRILRPPHARRRGRARPHRRDVRRGAREPLAVSRDDGGGGGRLALRHRPSSAVAVPASWRGGAQGGRAARHPDAAPQRRRPRADRRARRARRPALGRRRRARGARRRPARRRRAARRGGAAVRRGRASALDQRADGARTRLARASGARGRARAAAPHGGQDM
ncbi:MAG: hypothetical protein AVDCRST_MAG85-1700, partial [uncultured Solirubrobacteraceae bacterium]